MDLPRLLQQQAEQFLQPRMQDVVSQYQQELFELADKALNNQQQASLFANQKQVLQQQSQLLSRFDDFMGRQLDDFVQAKPYIKAGIDEQQVEDLSLLDKAELEDDLAVTVISHRSNNQHTELLWKLNRRLAVIRGGKALNDEANPFGAYSIANCAQQALSILSLSGKPKLLFYKVLEKHLLKDLGTLYEALNQALLDKGVLPNLKYQLLKPQKNTSAAAPEPSQAAQVTVSESDNAVVEQAVSTQLGNSFTPDAEGRQQALLQALLSQLQQQSQSPLRQQAQSYFEIADEMANGADSFNSTDFAMALSCLQTELPNAGQVAALDGQKLNERFFSQLATMQKSISRHQLGINDLGKVELVGQLFSQILSDEVLADKIKALLSHLHTPILKVALIDEGFLQQPDHNVRRFLALLTELGAKYAGNEAVERSLLNKFKAIIARILHEFVDDLSVFNELSQELVLFSDNLSKRAAAAEQRNIEAAKGVAKLAEAKAQAQLRVEQHLAGRRLPTRVTQLFAKPWLDFVTFNILRHGEQSTLVKQALQVIDQLLWSLDTRVVLHVPELEYQRRQKRLERMILAGLATAGLDKSKQRELLDDLNQLQLQSLQQAQIAAATEAEVVEAAATEAEVVEAEVVEAEVVEAEVVETEVVEAEVVETEVAEIESAVYKQALSAEALADNQTRFLVVEAPSSQADVLRQTAQAATQFASLSTKPAICVSNKERMTQIERQLFEQTQKRLDAEQTLQHISSTPEPSVGDDGAVELESEPKLGDLEASSQPLNSKAIEPSLDHAQLDQEAKSWQQGLKDLQFGSWYYRHHQGQKQLLKLAWFSELSDNYMFVNQAGVKVANLSGQELGVALQQAVIYQAEDEQVGFLEKLFGGLLQKNRSS